MTSPAAVPLAAGDQIPADCRPIEVRVSELKQLFNDMDPAPFRQRDLDPNAEEFIVEWAREIPSSDSLALIVHLDRPAGLPEEAAMLREAVHAFFTQRALATRRRLRQLFRVGRTSLAIGVSFLAVSVLAGDLVAQMLGEHRIGEIIRESVLIGGWVAMWRPLEVFLYDWWPIRAEARLADRLAAMPVRLSYRTDASRDAWRSDWPAAAKSAPPRELTE